jgi:drug/metabolite transporter (DMT)-like permease
MKQLNTEKEGLIIDISLLQNFTCLLMVGLMYCLQQLCVCKAMQYGQPGKTSLLKYLDVVLPFLFQFVIFR